MRSKRFVTQTKKLIEVAQSLDGINRTAPCGAWAKSGRHIAARPREATRETILMSMVCNARNRFRTKTGSAIRSFLLLPIQMSGLSELCSI